jgi:hypothetical protein
MIVLFILMMLFIGAMFHFEPIIIKLDNGQIVIDYRPNRKTDQRKQIKLW